MCRVTEYVTRLCGHHHHWELATPCNWGFDEDLQQCNAGNPETIRRADQSWPSHCMACLNKKIESLNQAFNVMLIRMKAATMNQSLSHDELGRRYETWRIQSVKEIYRLTLQCGYELINPQPFGDITEDDFDPDWHHPLEREDLHAQLLALNEQVNQGSQDAKLAFWRAGRPNTHEQPRTTAVDDSAEGGVEATNEEPGSSN